MTRLTLASASPRRRQLLGRIVDDFVVSPSNIDETSLIGESPEEFVGRLASTKARAGRQTVVSLGADTVVVHRNRIMTKPVDAEACAVTLRHLSGSVHKVLTGVAVIDDTELRTAIASTSVEFATLTDEEIAWYIATGEWTDKAGGYGIQGIGEVLVSRIEGSVSNVIGLPLRLTAELLSTSMPQLLGRSAAHG